MFETIAATVVYGLIFYFVFLGRLFDLGKFDRGN